MLSSMGGYFHQNSSNRLDPEIFIMGPRIFWSGEFHFEIGILLAVWIGSIVVGIGIRIGLDSKTLDWIGALSSSQFDWNGVSLEEPHLPYALIFRMNGRHLRPLTSGSNNPSQSKLNIPNQTCPSNPN